MVTILIGLVECGGIESCEHLHLDDVAEVLEIEFPFAAIGMNNESSLPVPANELVGFTPPLPILMPVLRGASQESINFSSRGKSRLCVHRLSDNALIVRHGPRSARPPAPGAAAWRNFRRITPGARGCARAAVRLFCAARHWAVLSQC